MTGRTAADRIDPRGGPPRGSFSSATPGFGPRDNMKGAALMAAAMAAFTANDACMKALSGDLPLGQAIFLRGCIGSALVAGLVARAGVLRAADIRGDVMRVWPRVGAEVAAAFLFITAIFHMPLANATAILQALPLTVALAGAAFLGEPLGRRRLIAILVGLAGVMLIVRPAAEGFDVYALYALGAVAAVTLRDLTTRRVPAHIPSLRITLYSAVAVTVFGLGLTGLQGWAPVSWLSVAKLAGAAVFILCAYQFSIAAMRVGEIGPVSPFRYTGLLWALLLGVTLFGERPDLLTLTGAGIVVATGLYTLHRERVLARAAAAAAPRP